MQLRSSTGKVFLVTAHTQLGRSLDPRLPAVISRELATLTLSGDHQCELRATKPVAIIRREQARTDQRQVLRQWTLPQTAACNAVLTAESCLYSSSLKLQPNDRAHVLDGDYIVMRWDKSGLHGFELQAGSHVGPAVRIICLSACIVARLLTSGVWLSEIC